MFPDNFVDLKPAGSLSKPAPAPAPAAAARGTFTAPRGMLS